MSILVVDAGVAPAEPLHHTRRLHEAYFTPGWATRALLQHLHTCLSPGATVLECCAGRGDIARALTSHGLHVATNDPYFPSEWAMDASAQIPTGFDWVISNPPFSRAAAIVPRAYAAARVGVAMLLRLTYLEPCQNRAAWLRDHPPSDIVILPRHSFTGDGKTDSVTCAWMVWDKRATAQRIHIEVAR